ncbi:hypothetical protein MRX96_030411 [Rhipicephalus microplus]
MVTAVFVTFSLEEDVFTAGFCAAHTSRCGICQNRPVVVVLHGGHFQFGGGGTYAFYGGLHAAALWDAVVVVPAYRVGAFGFLNMLVPDAPGNVGLLDQALAIRWVHRYIHHFGGDNQRITLLGQDAGATSIGLPPGTQRHAAYKTSHTNERLAFRTAAGQCGSACPTERQRLGQMSSAVAAGVACRTPPSDDGWWSACESAAHPSWCWPPMSWPPAANTIVFGPSKNSDFPWKLAGTVQFESILKHVDFLVGVSKDEGTSHVSQLMQAFGLSADQTLTPRRLLSMFLAFLEALRHPRREVGVAALWLRRSERDG